MWWGVAACVTIVTAYILHLTSADHPVINNQLAKVKPQGCTTFIFEGKGDFKLQKKIYTPQKSQHYIQSLRLVRRTSFYKCQPRDEKYGISDDGHSWWVDRGCEAIFEVVECPNNGLIPPPDSLKKMYEELRKRLAAATQNVDLTNWNVNSVANRFKLRRMPTRSRNARTRN